MGYLVTCNECDLTFNLDEFDNCPDCEADLVKCDVCERSLILGLRAVLFVMKIKCQMVLNANFAKKLLYVIYKATRFVKSIISFKLKSIKVAYSIIK